MSAPVVDVSGVAKRYGAIQALDGVDLQLFGGEIVGLLGANGAGKSTLIKIVSGLEHSDDGTVRVDGEELPRLNTVKAAQAAGISVVPQELNLVMTATVAENILLWHLPTRAGLLSRRAMRARARAVLEDLGVELDVNRSAADLTAVEQRLVMVAAAMSQEARVLILDEPTAALPPHEAQHVLDVAERLRDLGKTVVFVSHRLNEVSDLVDRAVVMREGRVVGELREGDLDVDSMIERLGGARIGATSAEALGKPQAGGAVGLAATGLCGVKVQDVDVEIRTGEIVGVAGLVGAGRSELLRLLGGVQSTSDGEVLLDGEPLGSATGLRGRVGYVGEDRSKNLFREFDVTGNMSLPSLRRFVRATVIRRRAEVAEARDVVDRVGIKGRPQSSVWGLSGGNRQKVLLGRWLMSGADLLLLDEPTAGLDPAARAEVHRLLRKHADGGGAVVLAIADPAELLAVSDRVIVMREGRVAHVASRPFDGRVILAASYAEHRDQIEEVL